MKYAQTGTVEFSDKDGDALVLKEEPTGSQYDERMNMLGRMRIPGNILDGNTNMQDLFAHGEMVEISLDKSALAEFQFKALFVSMTIGGKQYTAVSDAIAEYRRFAKETKDWIDEQVDSVWAKHEKDTAKVAKKEGKSEK